MRLKRHILHSMFPNLYRRYVMYFVNSTPKNISAHYNAPGQVHWQAMQKQDIRNHDGSPFTSCQSITTSLLAPKALFETLVLQDIRLSKTAFHSTVGSILTF